MKRRESRARSGSKKDRHAEARFPDTRRASYLVNSDPRSPSLQELHAHVRAAYHQGLLGMESGRLFRTEHLEGIADRMATARAASVQALVNSRLRSPTVEEIIDTLRPPQRPRRPMVEYVPSADDDESEISESGHVPRSAAPLR